MPLPPINIPTHTSLADGVHEALRAAIIRGVLDAGVKLTEVSLAGHLNVSRTPIREALRRLQAEGLLVPSGRSLMVSEVSLEALAELCVVREALEGLAARLAASQRNDIDLWVLADLNNSMHRAVEEDDFQTVIRTNHAFHSTVWQAAHNGYLTTRLAELRETIERMQTSTLHTHERRVEALQEHEEILLAIKSSDADGAERVTREHFRKAEAIRLRQLRLKAAHQLSALSAQTSHQ
ncbi:GntR family transcriptional regulator [Deinococcus peraridilitoris]|uniref:Transcriptional regulator n=1 Tax=Deinococcus peraridilitoris (strain DSM 19664 / LMG 22246 / CIP 109416 / KR-200) TaxID=937777 RepID=L0A8V9_DEIPD|nr:GntR family transcriptional regulator [Deinococcus peraridilitoris]AFZ69577.1 transcriptional regulator [Deinococcus peraridilitoris DSM 19664]